MNFNEKFRKPTDNEKPTLPDKMEKEHFMELGLKFAKSDPRMAEDFFKRAGVSISEIESALAQQEFKTAAEKEKERGRIIEMRQRVKEMYEQIISDAKKKSDEERVKIYEAALEELKKVSDK